MDDLPGRARLSWYTGRPCADGWEDEIVYFYGVDGRWRSLNLAELNLPARSWDYGCDTYGAGALSPNGRWWIGRATDRIFVLDLKSGRLVSRRLRYGAGSYQWAEDGSALLVYGRGDGYNSASLFRVPSLKRSHADIPDRDQSQPIATINAGYAVMTRAGNGVDPQPPYRLEFYEFDGAFRTARTVTSDLLPGSGQLIDIVGDRTLFALDQPKGVDDELLVTQGGDFDLVARLLIPEAATLYGGVGTYWADQETFLFAISHVDAWLISQGRVVRVLRSPALPKDAGAQSSSGVSIAANLLH